MKMEIEVETTGAYQLGFKHGLKEGVDMNAYENDLERIWYLMQELESIAEVSIWKIWTTTSTFIHMTIFAKNTIDKIIKSERIQNL
jgi:hypothetical protein